MADGGVQAWAGGVGSGGRPRRRRRHAGAGPVAVAGRCGRTDRRPAVAVRAPLHGVGGRAGGGRAAQAKPWGAHVQGRRGQGRSVVRCRGAAWGGAGAQQRGAAQGRSVGLRRGAACGRAGVQRGAA